MCDYCDENNKLEDCKGGFDIIAYDKKSNEYRLYYEHFRNEMDYISDIKYCPMCGRKLNN